jgi:hypothetical protein
MNDKANQWHPYKGRTIPNVVTRQQVRAHYREFAVGEITEKFSGESRRQRRGMGFALGNRNFRIKRGLPEPRESHE